MRILLAIVLAAAMSGCSDNRRVTTPKDRPQDESSEIKRSDRELILDAVLHDVLNNPDLKDTREFYGTAGDHRIALVTDRDYGIAWPAGYQPVLPGWTVIRVEWGADPDPNEPRLLGIRINKFSEKNKGQVSEKNKEQAKLLDSPLLNSPINVTIFNAGGSKNGDVIGGCIVYYRPKQVGGKWVVQLDALLDP